MAAESESTPPRPPHVLIVGAGLGGLALAQILRKNSIPYSIFERGPSNLHQGWCIMLHTILTELQAALPDDLPPLAESVNHLQPLTLRAQIVFYYRGEVADRRGVEADGAKGAMVRANRSRLREYLRTHIPVQFDKTAVEVAEGEGGVTVTFKDGSSAKGDILIGADGVHSVVRQALMDGIGKPDPLSTASADNITGEVILSGADFARQLELGHSGYIVRGAAPESRTFVGLNRVSDDGRSGDYYWIMMHPAPPPGQQQEVEKGREPGWTARAGREEMRAFAVAASLRVKDPLLTQVVRDTPVSGIMAPPLKIRTVHLDELPAGRTTLLGDAAHAMTPFRGEGGVNALWDSIRLGESLVALARKMRAGNHSASTAAGGDLIKEALSGYHGEMLERGQRAVRDSIGVVHHAPQRDNVPDLFLDRHVQPLPVEKITIS